MAHHIVFHGETMNNLDKKATDREVTKLLTSVLPRHYFLISKQRGVKVLRPITDSLSQFALVAFLSLENPILGAQTIFKHQM